PHVSSGVRSAGCNLIATRVFGMSETIAVTGKSVKLFKGHYTSSTRRPRDASTETGRGGLQPDGMPLWTMELIEESGGFDSAFVVVG
ncbi:MAG: hypothetical protein ACREYE_31450, partial [Gammaproteobacteria bacterium]